MFTQEQNVNTLSLEPKWQNGTQSKHLPSKCKTLQRRFWTWMRGEVDSEPVAHLTLKTKLSESSVTAVVTDFPRRDFDKTKHTSCAVHCHSPKWRRKPARHEVEHGGGVRVPVATPTSIFTFSSLEVRYRHWPSWWPIGLLPDPSWRWRWRWESVQRWNVFLTLGERKKHTWNTVCIEKQGTCFGEKKERKKARCSELYFCFEWLWDTQPWKSLLSQYPSQLS